MKHCLNTSRTEDLIIKYYDLMIGKYRINSINKTRPYEGIARLMDELTARKIKLAIFSNKEDELAKKVVAALLPSWTFEVVIGISADIPIYLVNQAP